MFEEFKTMYEERGLMSIVVTTHPVMKEVIRFCYTAEINFTDEVTAEEVLAVAHNFEIELLFQICEKKLIETLNHGNLTDRLKLAKKFEAKDLLAGAVQYFKRHFDEVVGAVLEFN